ncbi:PKD domain-containing protein, partial [Chloroflexota bacterium]
IAIALERGNDVSFLLARVKNDHLGQQAVLQEATAGMPEWAIEGMDTTRAHAAALLLEGVRQIEGGRAASQYASTLEAAYPGLVEEAAFFAASPIETEVATSTSDPIVITGTADQGKAEATTEEFAPASASAPPDIASMSVDPEVVEPGDTCRVRCSVIADEGQHLEYLWLCSRGEVEGAGDRATWTAPSKTGTYKVVVTVTDSEGQNDSLAIDVRVREPEEEEEEDEDEGSEPAGDASGSGSTEILGFQVTAEHKYLEPSMVGYSILVGRACTIQCDVEDPSGVSFDWSATGGELAVNGDTAVWTSPHTVGNLEVSVTVSNGSGDSTTKTIPFHVTTCSQCFG